MSMPQQMNSPTATLAILPRLCSLPQKGAPRLSKSSWPTGLMRGLRTEQEKLRST